MVESLISGRNPKIILSLTNSKNLVSSLLKKLFFPGWSKTFRCKARDIMRNEAYFTVRRNDPDRYRE